MAFVDERPETGFSGFSVRMYEYYLRETLVRDYLLSDERVLKECEHALATVAADITNEDWLVENDVAMMCSAYYAFSKIVTRLEDELETSICRKKSADKKEREADGEEEVTSSSSEEDVERLDASVETEVRSEVDDLNEDDDVRLPSRVSTVSSSLQTTTATA
eukprot:jgi/Bigna1/147511/aug1.178_g22219